MADFKITGCDNCGKQVEIDVGEFSIADLGFLLAGELFLVGRCQGLISLVSSYK